MVMQNPPHPGRTVRSACFDACGLTVTEGARRLGVARHTLSRMLNGHAGISPEMAIRLEKMGWSTARAWLAAQSAYDLNKAKQKAGDIKVAPLEATGA